MSTYNPMQHKYSLWVQGDGEQMEITNAVESGSWSDTSGDAIGKLTLKLVNCYVPDKEAYLESLVPNGSKIHLKNEDELVGIFTVRQNTFDYSISGQSISITAYDRIYNLANCRESWHYTQDKTTDWLIQDIFERAETPVDFDYPTTTHDLILTKNETMLNEVTDILDKAYNDAGDEKPILIMVGDTAKITTNGWNEEVYEFKDVPENTLDKGNIISITRNADISNIVTRVLMLGKELDDASSEFLGTVEGHIEYDVLQKVIYQDAEGTKWDLKREAKRILRDEGEQELDLSIETPDVHYIRKGHKIKIDSASGIKGEYFVTSVSHDIKDRRMSMTIMQPPEEVDIELSEEELEEEAAYKAEQEKQEEEKGDSGEGGDDGGDDGGDTEDGGDTGDSGDSGDSGSEDGSGEEGNEEEKEEDS